MTDTHQEKFPLRSSSETPAPKQSENRELHAKKETHTDAAGVIEAGIDSGVDASEAAETIGNVSETTQEDTSKGSQGSMKGSGHVLTDEEKEQIRARLLASAPPQHVMMRQIRKSLLKQEDSLHSEYRHLVKNAGKNAFKLVEVVKRLRKMREYFSLLAHATYEMVKHLWLKIVHGV